MIDVTCVGIAFSLTPCAGKVKGYKTSDWPGLVNMCQKHLKEFTKEAYDLKGELS